MRKLKTRAQKTYGVKYGVIITKPWSNEMYEHNDKVSEVMKEHITKAIETIKSSKNEEELQKISRMICYYGFGDGYDFNDIYEETLKELETMENYRLQEDYPDMVKAGFVPELNEYFVGYDK